MAQFKFYVGRKGEEPVECVANVPTLEEMLKFDGGTVTVKTPKGDVKVYVSKVADLIVSSMTIELQNGVRDTIFPKEDQAKAKSKKTGYQS